MYNGNVFLQDLSTLGNKDWKDCLFGKAHTDETVERNHYNGCSREQSLTSRTHTHTY